MEGQEKELATAAETAFARVYGDGEPDANDGKAEAGPDGHSEDGKGDAGAGDNGPESGSEGEASGASDDGLAASGGEGGPASGQDEGSGAGGGTGGQEELERLRQHAKTQEGRLSKAEEERQRALDELETLKAGKDRAGAPDPDAPRPVEIPKGLEADAAEFDELFPDLAPLLRIPGPAGDRLRRVLKESGADVAGIAAENMALRARLDAGLQDVDARAAARTQELHLARLAERHPEIRGLAQADPAEREKARAYKAGVQTWIETLPYKDAAEKMRVFEKGSADEVDALLTAYKQTTSEKPQNARLDADTRRRAAEAEGVDNRRAARPKAGKTPEDRRLEAIERAYPEA